MKRKKISAEHDYSILFTVQFISYVKLSASPFVSEGDWTR